MTTITTIYRSKEYAAVKFVPKEGCWVFSETNKRLRGVRTTLQQRAFPRYNYKAALRNCPTPDSARVKTGVRSARGGAARGAAVHEQLHAIAAHGLAEAEKMYKAKNIDLEPLTVAILKDFSDKKLHVVGAELPVYDEREPLCLGSSIDLICEHAESKKLVIMELKVGGDNYYTKYNSYMENELKEFKIENSPVNQALLQLAVYKMLFERCYGKYVSNEQVESYRVVFAGPSGIVHRPLLSSPSVQTSLLHMMSAARTEKNNNAKNNKRKK